MTFSAYLFLPLAFWDDIDQAAVTCPQYNSNSGRAKVFYASIKSTIYCSVGGLILATHFFLLKPKNLEEWWKRGRYFMLLLFLLTASAAISLAVVSETFIALTKNGSNDYCGKNLSEGVAVAFFLIAVFLAAIYLFL